MRLLDVPVEAIRAGDNDRTKFADPELREMADSIEANGLLQPPTLRPYGKDEYEVVAGERRLRAVRLLGWTTITAYVRPLSDEEASVAMLVENLQRVDLDPMEEAKAYRKRLGDTDVAVFELATAVGVAPSRIMARLILLELVDEAQRLISLGRLPVAHAERMKGLDADRQYLALGALVRENLTRLAFGTLCERLRNEQAADPLFDASTFLRVEDYIAEAKEAALSPAARRRDVGDRMAAALEAAGIDTELAVEWRELATQACRVSAQPKVVPLAG